MFLLGRCCLTYETSKIRTQCAKMMKQDKRCTDSRSTWIKWINGLLRKAQMVFRNRGVSACRVSSPWSKCSVCHAWRQDVDPHPLRLGCISGRESTPGCLRPPRGWFRFGCLRPLDVFVQIWEDPFSHSFGKSKMFVLVKDFPQMFVVGTAGVYV